MPSNRAGKIVRCPECKATIRLGVPSSTESSSGKPIPMFAELVGLSVDKSGFPDEPDVFPSIDLTAGDHPPDEAVAGMSNEPETAKQPRQNPLPTLPPPSSKQKRNILPFENKRSDPRDAAFENLAHEQTTRGTSESAKDAATSRKKKRKKNRTRKSSVSSEATEPPVSRTSAGDPARPKEPAPVGHDKAAAEKLPGGGFSLPVPAPPVGKARHKKQITTQRLSSTPSTDRVNEHVPDPSVASPIGLSDAIQIDTEFKVAEVEQPSPATIRARARESRSDRMILTRFIAVCILILGVINLAPAISQWLAWSSGTESGATPRWIYILMFLAALHLVYAIYLIQIPDWSALISVSIAMLAFAFVFGVVSTGLVLGGSQGTIARTLQLATVLTGPASIWCVAMLCLATLVSYMGGREAINWHRADRLLAEIISSKARP